MSRVTVVGLGPAGPDLVTAGTRAALERVPVRYLRTTRHPAAAVATFTGSFDEVYDAAATVEEVYERIVEALVEGADEHGEVLYAVPGSPRVAERSVELLASDGRVEVEVLPALSFVDLAWSRLGVDPLAAGARLVDGQRFAVDAAGERGPLLVSHCHTKDVLSDVKLALDAHHLEGPPVARVVVLQRLGLPDEAVFAVAADDLDRDVQPDHLTSLWLPELAAPVAGELARFAELVRTLRERCPWDREQTHGSLTRHLLEETYEALEAITGLDPEPTPEAFDHLCEELGDLLFQVVFHATLAAEEGAFTLADVARGVHDKLVSRHPHVFGSVAASTAGEVMRNWEQLKKAEKGRASVMEGIPGDLPALAYAAKVQRKAAGLLGGAGDAAEPAWDEAASRLDRLRAGGPEAAGEVGPLLAAVVAGARSLEVDPEAALRGAAGQLRRRVEAFEALVAAEGVDPHTADPATVAGFWTSAGAAAGVGAGPA